MKDRHYSVEKPMKAYHDGYTYFSRDDLEILELINRRDEVLNGSRYELEDYIDELLDYIKVKPTPYEGYIYDQEFIFSPDYPNYSTKSVNLYRKNELGKKYYPDYPELIEEHRDE